MHEERENRTVYELVNDDEVILDRLLVDLAEVRLRYIDELVAELEDKRSVCIGPEYGLGDALRWFNSTLT